MKYLSSYGQKKKVVRAKKKLKIFVCEALM